MMRKKDWDYLGGNDGIFAPVSYEDIDMYVRMGLEGYNCVHTTKSILYHFAARGSHFQGQGDASPTEVGSGGGGAGDADTIQLKAANDFSAVNVAPWYTGNNPVPGGGGSIG